MAHLTRAEKIRKARAEKRAAKLSSYTNGPKRTQGENHGGPDWTLRALHAQGAHNCGNVGCRRCNPACPPPR